MAVMRGLTVKVPAELVEKLDEIARSSGITRSELIRSILLDYVMRRWNGCQRG